MSAHDKPAPVEAKFWTPGVCVMLIFMIIGLLFIVARYIGGLAAVTNLDNAYPWGLWIGIDVATGVALAAGGFTTAALAHVFGRHQYESITRPALLTAMLGYTFVSLGLVVDLGRSWAIWHGAVYWQGNSVLFEVAMCVMIYLHVLYIEFIPVIVERYKGEISLPGRLSRLDPVLERLLAFLDRILNRIMWVFIIAGVVLSCMHQSSLGTLMLIAPTKLHPLWYTPILPLLFLTSAISVGFPMVVFETTLTRNSLRLDGEMEVLTPLTRITVFLLGTYMVLKIGDMVVRGTYVYLLDGTVQSLSFMVEMFGGVIIPWFMLLTPGLRQSRQALFGCSVAIIGGVALNRINVFLLGYQPPYAETPYFPSIGEIAITTGLICALMFIYRVAVTYLPILNVQEQEVSS